MKTRLIHILKMMTHCTPPQLGRWKLKHKCITEDITVHQANRDHCGDIICGYPQKYQEFTESVKMTGSKNQ